MTSHQKFFIRPPSAAWQAMNMRHMLCNNLFSYSEMQSIGTCYGKLLSHMGHLSSQARLVICFNNASSPASLRLDNPVVLEAKGTYKVLDHENIHQRPPSQSEGEAHAM